MDKLNTIPQRCTNCNVLKGCFNKVFLFIYVLTKLHSHFHPLSKIINQTPPITGVHYVLKVKNRPWQTRWGTEVYLYSFFNFGATWLWVVDTWPQQHRPNTHCKEGWRSPEQVCRGAENLASTGIQNPVNPAHGKSLYWLHYPGLHSIYYSQPTDYEDQFCTAPNSHVPIFKVFQK